MKGKKKYFIHSGFGNQLDLIQCLLYRCTQYSHTKFTSCPLNTHNDYMLPLTVEGTYYNQRNNLILKTKNTQPKISCLIFMNSYLHLSKPSLSCL